MSAEVAPIMVSVVLQLGPLSRTIGRDTPWIGDLDLFARQLADYLSRNLEAFTDPRGGDVFLALTAQRGEEKAGHEYRSGHYVKEPS